jgi:hypothetical protein
MCLFYNLKYLHKYFSKKTSSQQTTRHTRKFNKKMAKIKRLLDGFPIETMSSQEESIEFVATDMFSPNLLRKVNKGITFPNLGRGVLGNAVQIITDSIANFGIQRLIPYKEILVGRYPATPDMTLFDGFMAAFGKKTYLESEHEIVENTTSFADWAKSFNIRDFNPNTSPSDGEVRRIMNDDTTDIATLRAEYQNTLLPPALRITPADYVDIKYLDRKLRPLDVLILLGTVVMMILQILDIVKQLADASGTTFLAGVGAVLLVTSIAKLLFLGTFIFVYLFEWNKSVPKPKTSKGVKLKRVFEKICEVYGFTLQSTTILETTEMRDLVLWEGLTNPLPNQTVFEFINEWCGFFNAKIKVQNDKLIFETIQYFWDNPNPYTIPLMQEPDVYEENYSEVAGSVLFEFQKDADAKERRFGEKLTARYSRVDAVLGERQFNGLGVAIQTRYSRAYQKERLTDSEKAYNLIVAIFLPLSVIISAVSSIFGGSGFSFLISPDNVGCVQLEDEFLSSPKLLIIDNGGKVTTERNQNFVNAAFIFNKYHRYMSPKRNGQWVKVTGVSPRDLRTTNPDLTLYELVQNNVCYIQIADNETKAVSTHLFVINKFTYGLEDNLIQFEGYALKHYTDANKIKETVIVD